MRLEIRFVLASCVSVGTLGCSKMEHEIASCEYLHTTGVIFGLDAPDSALKNEQRELVVGVFTPGLCVGEITVNVTPTGDSLYYLDADVAYNADRTRSCDCRTADHHFVRVFFRAPKTGKIVITTALGLSPAPADTIIVY